MQSAKASLAAMKTDLAKGNYQAVRANASYLTSAVDSLEGAVAARRAERESDLRGRQRQRLGPIGRA